MSMTDEELEEQHLASGPQVLEAILLPGTKRNPNRLAGRVALYDHMGNPLDLMSGSQGPVGPVGPVGPKGDKGDKGDPGDKGATGAQGAAGIQGPKGDTGTAGATGAQGVKGDKGDKGDTGPAGAIGNTGAAGPTGATGPAGTQGPKGDPGATGATGAAGAQGAKGDKGDPGPQGSIGATGATGATGTTGAQGPAGVQGPKGDTGTQGPIGNTGAQGTQGPKGDPGPQGAVGNTGAQGPQGAQGPAGVAGPQGDPNTPLYRNRIWCTADAYRAASFDGSTAYHVLEVTATMGNPSLQLTIPSQAVEYFLEVEHCVYLMRKDDAAYHYIYEGLRLSPADADGQSIALVAHTQHSAVNKYEGSFVRRTFRCSPNTVYVIQAIMGGGQAGGQWNYMKTQSTYLDAVAYPA